MNQNRSADADKLLERLAVSSPNDAVKLLYLSAEDVSELEVLDLSLLSERKRGPKGEVELKFVNKLAIIRAQGRGTAGWRRRLLCGAGQIGKAFGGREGK